MSEFNDELSRLQERVARYHKLQAGLDLMRSEEESIASEERELAKLLAKEQHDVDVLERVSLASIVSAIRGNKEELLNKERMEARAAALKHDTAVRRLEQIRADFKIALTEIRLLSDSEARFDEAVAQRLREIKLSGGETSEKIYRLEERIGHLNAQMKEIREAMSACNAAMQQIYSIEDSLRDAEGWGTLDMLGGGLISTMAKHSHLDDAQGQIERLQYLLSRVRTELADIHISTDIQIQVDGFMRFADYFFDGLFSDWMVQGRIHSSQQQVSATKSRISSITGQLQRLSADIERQLDALKKELAALATGA